MRRRFFNREHTFTAFVLLDPKKCEACWKCLKACTNNVIGRVNLPWHKHALIVNGTACTGCLKCVKICRTGAIVKQDNE